MVGLSQARCSVGTSGIGEPPLAAAHASAAAAPRAMSSSWVPGRRLSAVSGFN